MDYCKENLGYLNEGLSILKVPKGVGLWSREGEGILP